MVGPELHRTRAVHIQNGWDLWLRGLVNWPFGWSG